MQMAKAQESAISASGRGINASANAYLEALLGDGGWLRLAEETTASGARLVDAGIDVRGGLEGGRRIAELCMAGQGRVALVPGASADRPHWRVAVTTCDPALVCLGSQYAGWMLSWEGEEDFFALGSGPGRVLAGKEELIQEMGLSDTSDRTCLVLETGQRPPDGLVRRIADDCGVAPEKLTLVLTPTGSLAGTVQIAARVLEVAMHKVHALEFPLAQVVDGAASAPVPPPSPDFLTGMGRTNDAILFDGEVHLYVAGDDERARQLADRLPSSASRDYGRPFAEVFKAYDGDFSRIDPMLFSPARVAITNLDSGRTFRAGESNREALDASFGEGA
jgi:methenyltetrahydromethanopterin cyclohydrolase